MRWTGAIGILACFRRRKSCALAKTCFAVTDGRAILQAGVKEMDPLKRSSRVKLWFVAVVQCCLPDEMCCKHVFRITFIQDFILRVYKSKWKGMLYSVVGRESTPRTSICFSSSMNETPMFCSSPPPPLSSHDGIIDSLRLIFLNGNPIPERRLVHARVRCSLPSWSWVPPTLSQHNRKEVNCSS